MYGDELFPSSRSMIPSTLTTLPPLPLVNLPLLQRIFDEGRSHKSTAVRVAPAPELGDRQNPHLTGRKQWTLASITSNRSHLLASFFQQKNEKRSSGLGLLMNLAQQSILEG